ncbi:hypothetical protein [Holospora curviuscula]|uniref:Lipoprotein n=1 Tax=Holospora curviuscula TaxID=1082868 RepID=A0A2S5RDF6_9PROT|nr:hypothetical protein [Holospora curviuscula]PPE05334.1 hypothetical protein HCUR_00292 [Holospora curviuscula]
MRTPILLWSAKILFLIMLMGCGMKGKLRPVEKDSYPRSYPEKKIENINKKK